VETAHREHRPALEPIEDPGQPARGGGADQQQVQAAQVSGRRRTRPVVRWVVEGLEAYPVHLDRPPADDLVR
jgi:hypothetical protein